MEDRDEVVKLRQRFDEVGIRFEGKVLGRDAERRQRQEAELDALLALAEQVREKYAGVWDYDPVLRWHCRLE